MSRKRGKGLCSLRTEMERVRGRAWSEAALHARAGGENAAGDGPAGSREQNDPKRHDHGGGELAGRMAIGRQHKGGKILHGVGDLRRLGSLSCAGFEKVVDFLLRGLTKELVDGGAVMHQVTRNHELHTPGRGGQEGRGGSEDGADTPADTAVGEGGGAAAIESDSGESAANGEERTGFGERGKQAYGDGYEERGEDRCVPIHRMEFTAEPHGRLLRNSGIGGFDHQLRRSAVAAKTLSLGERVAAAMADRVHELTLSQAARERNWIGVAHSGGGRRSRSVGLAGFVVQIAGQLHFDHGEFRARRSRLERENVLMVLRAGAQR